MKFEDRFFVKFKFTKGQIKKNFDNASRDLNIAKQDRIKEVKFNYSYTTLIKAGIALLSFYDRKIRSLPGHHIKLIEKVSDILEDEAINDIGNLMRSKRNLDLYAGGVEVTEKECREYLVFLDGVLTRIKAIIFE